MNVRINGLELKTLLEGDPQAGFEHLLADLCERLRQQGVTSFSIEGVRIAMNFAFSLGERKTLQRIRPGAERLRRR